MGPDPLDPSFNAGTLQAALSGTRTTLKTRLMDQKVIAGLGNIALSDLCWRARVHPHRTCTSLNEADYERLTHAIVDHIHYVLRVEEGDEITYLGYAGAENPFLCYGRAGEACRRCEAPIVKGELAGRASYWCPVCQPLP